jgi:acyl-CoA synthetase (AMP-forming)/AMP-acid ligase II
MFWQSRSSIEDNQTFLVDDQGSLTYSDLFLSADSAFGAHARGVMAIICDKNRETVTGYVGALRAGHVPLLLDPTATAGSLHQQITRYEPEYVFSVPELVPPGYAMLDDVGTYVVAGRTDHHAKTDLHPDLAALIPTSGSTGDPKAVRLSCKNLASVTSCIADYLSLDHQRRAISLLPLQYSYGLSVLNATMEARGSFVITDLSPVTRDFWQIIVDRGVTDFSAVPFVFETIKRMQFSKDVMNTLCCVTQAGGRLDPKTTQHFLELFSAHGIEYFTMYGATEASPRIAYLHPDDAPHRHGSVGKPIAIGAVTLADIDPSGCEGELVYSGPNVCMGYSSTRVDLAAGDEFGGTLRTGDMARLDDDGFIYITGRLKRFVKVHGVSVNLAYVESQFREADFDLYVVGRENRISMVSEIDYGERILHFAKERFTFHPSVWHSVVIDRIPLTSSAKVDYTALDAQMAET